MHRPIQFEQHVDATMEGCAVGIVTDVSAIGIQRPMHVPKDIC